MNFVKIIANEYLDIISFQIYSLYNFAVMATYKLPPFLNDDEIGMAVAKKTMILLGRYIRQLI